MAKARKVPLPANRRVLGLGSSPHFEGCPQLSKSVGILDTQYLGAVSPCCGLDRVAFRKLHKTLEGKVLFWDSVNIYM